MEEGSRPSRREVILGAAAMGVGTLSAGSTAKAADLPKPENAPHAPESTETLKEDISLQFAQALSDEFAALGDTEPGPDFWQRMDAVEQRYAAEYEREYYPPEKDIDPE